MQIALSTTPPVGLIVPAKKDVYLTLSIKRMLETLVASLIEHNHYLSLDLHGLDFVLQKRPTRKANEHRPIAIRMIDQGVLRIALWDMVGNDVFVTRQYLLIGATDGMLNMQAFEWPEPKWATFTKQVGRPPKEKVIKDRNQDLRDKGYYEYTFADWQRMRKYKEDIGFGVLDVRIHINDLDRLVGMLKDGSYWPGCFKLNSGHNVSTPYDAWYVAEFQRLGTLVNGAPLPFEMGGGITFTDEAHLPLTNKSFKDVLQLPQTAVPVSEAPPEDGLYDWGVKHDD